MAKASRDKGKRFERWVANYLRDSGVYPDARRNPDQFTGGRDGDILDVPLRMEVKHDNQCSVWALLRQAEDDRATYNDPRPVVGVLKHDRKEPIVVMRWAEFVEEMLKR